MSTRLHPYSQIATSCLILLASACGDDDNPRKKGDANVSPGEGDAGMETSCERAIDLAGDAADEKAAAADRACSVDADCRLVPASTACSTSCLPTSVSRHGAEALREELERISEALCDDGEGGQCGAPILDCEAAGELAAECKAGECAVAEREDRGSVMVRVVHTNVEDDGYDKAYGTLNPDGTLTQVEAGGELGSVRAPFTPPYFEAPLNAAGHPMFYIQNYTGSAWLDPEIDPATLTEVVLNDVSEADQRVTVFLNYGSVVATINETALPTIGATDPGVLYIVNTLPTLADQLPAFGIAGQFCLPNVETDPNTPFTLDAPLGSPVRFFASRTDGMCADVIPTEQDGQPFQTRGSVREGAGEPGTRGILVLGQLNNNIGVRMEYWINVFTIDDVSN